MNIGAKELKLLRENCFHQAITFFKIFNEWPVKTNMNKYRRNIDTKGLKLLSRHLLLVKPNCISSSITHFLQIVSSKLSLPRNWNHLIDIGYSVHMEGHWYKLAVAWHPRVWLCFYNLLYIIVISRYYG